MMIRGSKNNHWADCGARLLLGGLLCLGPLALSLLATGCTTTTAATTDSCGVNTSIYCPGSTGYSCTGNVTPKQTDSTLVCGAGSGGDYCCYSSATGTSNSCSPDTSVPCTSGTGYTCTSSAVQPELFYSVVCGGSNGNDNYCCRSSSTCSYDPSVAGCSSSSWGYSCAHGDPSPDATDNTLICSIPVTAGGSDTYCCHDNTITVPAAATCQKDWTVSAACQPEDYGFSCTDSLEDPATDFLVTSCSSGVSGYDKNGDVAMLYCCTY